MSVSARYPPLRSRGRARSADSQRGRFGGRGVGERRMVADGGAPDCGTPAAGNARADSRRYFCAPSANQNIPRKVEKSRSVPPPQQSGPSVASRTHDVGAAGCRARFSASRRVPPSTRRRTRAAMHVILPSPHGPSTPEPPIIPPMKTKKPPRKTKRRPRSIHLTTLPNFNKNDRSSRCRRCPRR
jgi:hypothetical protein